MEYYNIIYIGGFAATKNYSQSMCKELQKITNCKVYNFAIHHGLTLNEECYKIFLFLKENDLIFMKKPYILIGFSTGCLIATQLSEYIPTKSIILINPAELLTRMNKSLLYSLIPPNECVYYSNINSYFSIFNKKVHKFYINSWKFFWKCMSWSHWLVIKFFGSKNVASFYYNYFGKKNNEPRADELMHSLFSSTRKFTDMLKTLVECLVKPNLYDLINRSKINKIHIIQGKKDYLYIPYGNILFNYNKKILYHNTIGNHHMIYYYPIETARKISAVLYK